ncbi:MAG TPA: AAA family ATPase [Pyrinomonadaceae bacterium]|jgi:LuxR family maltose regulon positive regulatory protein
MTMTFSLHENLEFIESAKQFDAGASLSNKSVTSTPENIHLFAEKLKIPDFKKNISRPRLNELLMKSSKQFGATLICGRSGTGKTALAADFARTFKDVAWLSVDSADCDWNVFSKYLLTSVLAGNVDFESVSEKNIDSDSLQTEISSFFGKLFSNIAEDYAGERLLIVLDDFHHIFDAEWFDDFFNLLLYSLLPNVHLLLLCRSKPAYPLWRLRSKQVLNVIDEKLLALDVEETERLYKKFGLAKENAKKAHRASFGRISKLMLSINSAMTK